MLPKDIQSLGGPFIDAEPVENPQTEQSADLGNRMLEDVAQMTRTSEKAFLKFATQTGNGSITPHADSRTQWGSSSAYFPTLSHTATGTYLATYDTEYDDGLVGGVSDAVAETETVSFIGGGGDVHGSTFGHVQVSLADNVVTIYVFDAAGALTDLGGGVTVEVRLQ